MKKMTQKQLKQVIAFLLTNVNPDVVDGDHAQTAIKDRELPSRFQEFLHTYKPRVPNILKIATDSIMFLGSKKFVASEHFRKDNPKVKFWGFGSDFEDWFIPKTEKNVRVSKLLGRNLLKNSQDSEIIKTLGGEEKIETSLAELYARLEAQGNGGGGPLLTDGNWNIFYIRDKDGALRAVYAGWSDDGWLVSAGGLGDGGWDGGDRVFSRN